MYEAFFLEFSALNPFKETQSYDRCRLPESIMFCIYLNIILTDHPIPISKKLDETSF